MAINRAGMNNPHLWREDLVGDIVAVAVGEASDMMVAEICGRQGAQLLVESASAVKHFQAIRRLAKIGQHLQEAHDLLCRTLEDDCTSVIDDGEFYHDVLNPITRILDGEPLARICRDWDGDSHPGTAPLLDGTPFPTEQRPGQEPKKGKGNPGHGFPAFALLAIGLTSVHLFNGDHNKAFHLLHPGLKEARRALVDSGREEEPPPQIDAEVRRFCKQQEKRKKGASIAKSIDVQLRILKKASCAYPGFADVVRAKGWPSYQYE